MLVRVYMTYWTLKGQTPSDPCSIYPAFTREAHKKRCAAVSLLLELSEAFSSMLTYSQVLRGGM